MASVFSTIYSWFAFVPRMTFKNVIEIALIALLVYEMLLWIKNTRAWTLLRGILFILAFFLFATILQLDTILWLLEKFSFIAVTALLIIFQPELRKALEQLAQQIGSDVAFCVAGGTALAEGRGEVLTDLSPMPDCWFVILKPGFSISTPELYKKLDSAPVRIHPDTQGLLAAVEAGDLHALCRRMYNVFEEVDDRRLRTVAELKGRLLDHKALGAMMTGTGSAGFGVFQEEGCAREACEALRREVKFCCTAKPVPRML